MAARGVMFNPFLPQFRQNPYPHYNNLRILDPVHWSTLGVWVLSRYADVWAVLRDTRFSADTRKWNGYQARYFRQKQGHSSLLANFHSKWMLFLDPPDHTRLRSLISKAFTPQVVESLRPRIQQIMNELIESSQSADTIDIIGDLAYPLPIIVIAEMLGLPVEDCDKLKQWSYELLPSFDPLMSLKVFERINQVVLEFTDYFRRIIAQRRNVSCSDLLSKLIIAEEQHDRLTESEIIATSIMLFVAGHETTVNLIGNSMYALLKHPEQLITLKNNPLLIQSAVEELLRYESPVQFTYRMALEDVEIGGKTIQQGQQVILCLGAANRDPSQFPDPDSLDITRQDNRHLAFSHGTHYCLGALLARAQGQIAINTLIKRFPYIKLTTEKPEWRETILLRGLKTLPVAFRPQTVCN
ncbi:MAG: cytochrome P450 [Acidobacteriota bacterium]